MKRLYVRILLWVVGLMVLGQLAVMGIFMATRGKKGGRAIRQHVTALARYLAADLERAGTTEAARGRRVRELAENLELQISLFDASGKLAVHAGEPLPSPVPEEARAGDTMEPGGTVKIVAMKDADGTKRRRFVVTVPYPSGGALRMASRHGGFESRAVELAAAFAGLAIVVGLLLIPLARRITRPLRELETAAQALARGDLTRRVRVSAKDEIGSLARAFNTMAEQIATALQQEKDLVTAVSHELRAPLARVRMAGELLLGTQDLPADSRRHLATINEEIDALDQLIDELITRAKLESAGFELERAPIDVASVAAEVARRAQPLELAGRGRVDVSTPAGKSVVIGGSQTLLARALRNIVENALQYSPPESRVAIEIAVLLPDRVVVRVVDHGMGIPPDEVPRVFDPFFRGERSRSRRTGGVGFGLTLTRDIVRRHGGEIAVESKVGEGTTVTVTLPVLKNT